MNRPGRPEGPKGRQRRPRPSKMNPKSSKNRRKNYKKNILQQPTLQERIGWIDRLRARISQKIYCVFNMFLSQQCTFCCIFIPYCVILSCSACSARLACVARFGFGFALPCLAGLVVCAQLLQFRLVIFVIQLSLVYLVSLVQLAQLVQFVQFSLVSLVRLVQFSLVQFC